ncbi:MAG: S-methyl-5'-thioadenosine phosphorylase [Planctomycetota bacterium]|nr:MAG: S-methyl-5'-thioadenosine phosphorylase [Planctomycetota bacterium]
MNERDRATIGVIGGSGVYDLAGLEDARELELNTPYGRPSDALLLGRLDGVEVAFLPRHGRGHRFTPSEVPYRANVYALRMLGVERLLSVSAVGSLCEEYAPGDFVLVDQFIDRTHRRVQTFFGDGIVAHVPMGDPVDPAMVEAVLAAAAEEGVTVHRGGAYVCIEGPQFSTRAESELYRSWGARIVGMTNGTEARLAREAGLAFACIAMVTDYDCWHPDHDHVDVEQVIRIAHRNAENVRGLVRRSIPRLAALGPSPWARVLEGAVMTRPDLIPADARERTEALFRRD